MNDKEKSDLIQFAKTVMELQIDINSIFRTKYYDYEIVTYVDEVQILDSEENIIISILKEDA
jgi:hypothetical protein